ncbi:hypothetical protein GGR52DRAFT_523034 [Hypoxylon sp. FL1284]|nr:hypothetical protein GGR52DRAFT_523034 [Hypoxylon sp. FL1284]
MYRYARQPLSAVCSVSRRAVRLPASVRPFSATPAARGPLLNAIRHDHRELEAYYPHIAVHQSADERTRYRNLFVWELARHSVAEELVVYPAMADHLEDGQAMASRDREQHQKVRVRTMSPKEKTNYATCATLTPPRPRSKPSSTRSRA